MNVRFAHHAVTAVTIVVSSALVADTLDCLAGRFLVSEADAAPLPRARPAPSPTPDHGDEAVATIIARNIFDHGEPPPDTEPPRGTAVAAVAGGCSLAIDVLSAVMVVRDPRLSLVTLREGASIDVFQIGDRIHDAELDAIGQGEDETNFVELLFDDGRRERCSAKSTHPTAVASASASSAGSLRAEIPEDDVARIMNGGLTSVLTMARAIPIIENGTPKGFRITAIVPNSIVARVGLQNDDVVRRVNGVEINTADDALRLVAMLRNERNVSVDVMRGGRAQTLEIAVR